MYPRPLHEVLTVVVCRCCCLRTLARNTARWCLIPSRLPPTTFLSGGGVERECGVVVVVEGGWVGGWEWGWCGEGGGGVVVVVDVCC